MNLTLISSVSLNRTPLTTSCVPSVSYPKLEIISVIAYGGPTIGLAFNLYESSVIHLPIIRKQLVDSF